MPVFSPQVWAWAGVTNCCVASVLNGIAPSWVFLTLIVWGLSCSAVGMVLLQRRVKRFELEQKMEAAFGYKT